MEATDVAPSRWQRAVQLAEQRIRQMRAFDEATLLVATDPPQVLSNWASSKRTLLRALVEARPARGGTDVRPALALARNLAECRLHGRVVLLSDGVWAEPPAKEMLANVDAMWISGDGVNAGITLFAARRALTGPGEFQLAARVESHGPAAVSGSLEVYRDGRLMDAQPLALEPGKPWEKTWDGRADQNVRFEAKLVGFPADRLARDDRAEAALAAQSTVTVDLIAPPNGFLDAAFKALNSVNWKRTWPADQLGATHPGVLYIFYRSLPPKDFAADACLIIDPSASGFWGELRGPIEQPLVSEFQRESPLLRHAGIDNVSLQSAREFAPAPGTEVLAETFGKPLIFGNWKGERRWLVLPFDLETSDFVLRTAFPIMLGNIVESLRKETAVPRSIQSPGRSRARSCAPPLPRLNRWRGRTPMFRSHGGAAFRSGGGPWLSVCAGCSGNGGRFRGGSRNDGRGIFFNAEGAEDAEGRRGGGGEMKENEVSAAVIGAAIEVHREIGPGLIEAPYEESMCHEMHLRGLGFRRQQSVPIRYKGITLSTPLRLDLIVEEKVIVDLKAKEVVTDLR